MTLHVVSAIKPREKGSICCPTLVSEDRSACEAEKARLEKLGYSAVTDFIVPEFGKHLYEGGKFA